MQKVDTINDIKSFDIDVYVQEFTGKSSAESKSMCDMWDEMPAWMQEMIEDSFEVKAARAAVPASGGLADLVKDEPARHDEFDDDIPF